MACPETKYLKLVNCKMKLAEIDRATCEVGGFRDVGEFPMLEIGATTEYAENMNTKGRIKVRDLYEPVSMTLTAKATLKEATLDNLAMLTYGVVQSTAGGPATALPFKSGILAGEEYLLPGYPTNITGLSIVDSAGSPITLTNNTQYTADLKNGTVKFLSVPGTQPYKATYTEPARKFVSLVRNEGAGRAYQLLITGENLGDNYKPTRVILFKIVPGASQTIKVKDGEDNKPAAFELDLNPLADLGRSNDVSNPLGQYGVWEPIG